MNLYSGPAIRLQDRISEKDNHIRVFEEWNNFDPGKTYQYGKVTQILEVPVNVNDNSTTLKLARVVIYKPWSATSNELSGNGYCQAGRRRLPNLARMEIQKEKFQFVFATHCCDQIFLIKDSRRLDEPHLYLVVEGYDINRRHPLFNNSPETVVE